MKIKYLLFNEGPIVYFSVLKMAERFRNEHDIRNDFCYEHKNGINVASKMSPEIQKDTVYLRGSDMSADNNLETLELYNTENAEEYVELVNEAIEGWAKNWEGFNQEEKEISHLRFVYEL